MEAKGYLRQDLTMYIECIMEREKTTKDCPLSEYACTQSIAFHFRWLLLRDRLFNVLQPYDH